MVFLEMSDGIIGLILASAKTHAQLFIIHPEPRVGEFGFKGEPGLTIKLIEAINVGKQVAPLRKQRRPVVNPALKGTAVGGGRRQETAEVNALFKPGVNLAQECATLERLNCDLIQLTLQFAPAR